MCLALYQGMAAVNANARMPCIHQFMPRMVAAESTVIPADVRSFATASPTGDQAAHAGLSTISPDASCKNPVNSMTSRTDTKTQSSTRHSFAEGRNSVSF